MIGHDTADPAEDMFRCVKLKIDNHGSLTSPGLTQKKMNVGVTMIKKNTLGQIVESTSTSILKFSNNISLYFILDKAWEDPRITSPAGS